MILRGSRSPYSVVILQGVGEWILVLSVGRCVIPCAFFGKSANIHFLVEKYILNKKKRCLHFFFLDILMSQ